MQKTVRLVFSGSLQPGRNLDEVKSGLPALLKISPDQAEKLFSGRPVVIKRGLSQEKLAAYQALLEKAGLQVQAEDEAPVIEFDIENEAAPESPQSVVIVEEMSCPQCGVKQPKRTLCRECGVDMPRYAAAQATLQSEAINPPNPGKRPYHAAGELVLDEDLPSIFGASFDGRLNRMRYLIYGLAAQAAMILLALILMGATIKTAVAGEFPLLSILLFGTAFLTLVFYGLRYSAQRLHDMGFTGWLILLSFVPILGGLIWIWMAVWPGNQDENQYGPPNPPNSLTHKVIVLGLSLLLVLLFGVAFKKVMAMQDNMLQRLPVQTEMDAPVERM